MYLALCEDDAEDRNAVCSLLDAWAAAHDVALRRKTFQDAEELLGCTRWERFTLYLLDVMMPGMNGIECARRLRRFDDAAEIVFLSSYPDFAYEGYDVRALNYLLKPVEQTKLFALLDRLWLEEQKNAETLTVESDSAIVRVRYDQIDYVEVIRKHVYFHLTGGAVQEIAGRLRDYEDALLRRPEFMRVHRSYIVNMLQVEQFAPAELRTFRGDTLPVSRNVYPQLKKNYLALLRDRRIRAR